jgi:hypothetical protein
MPRNIVAGCLAVLLTLPALSPAQEPVKEDAKLAAERLDLMRKRMAAIDVSSQDQDFPDKFAAEPIFKYTDPARTYVAAAIWKLGDKGRPRALMSTELRRQFFGTPRIIYEYLSLTTTPFSAKGGDVNWSPEGSALEFKAIPDAPAPERTPERRLLQLRALAKRFGGYEVLGEDRAELRVLPQPVDRYQPSSEERADGALFLLTFGTNPEAALFLETDGKTWTYAAGRLAGAGKIALTLDEKPAWEGPRIRYSASSTYTATNAPIDIPGIAADGSELEE